MGIYSRERISLFAYHAAHNCLKRLLKKLFLDSEQLIWGHFGPRGGKSDDGRVFGVVLGIADPCSVASADFGGAAKVRAVLTGLSHKLGGVL